ncbi:MAG: WG repeat-containing protein [Eubacteriales bacterium]
MKKILSLLLASSMTLSLATVSFATDKEYGTLKYEEIIAPQYEDGSSFSNGLAAVKKDGKWGYINQDNQVVVDFLYDDAGHFNEGYAVVGTRFTETWESGNYSGEHIYLTYGVVDTNGNYTQASHNGEDIVSEIWDKVDQNQLTSTLFHNGYAVIFGDMMGYAINTSGVAAKALEDASFAPYNEGIWVISNYYYPGMSISLDGAAYSTEDLRNYVQETMGEYAEIGQNFAVNQGLLPLYVATDWDEDYKFGFLDVETMTWAIEPQYEGYYYNQIYTTQEFFGMSGIAMLSKNGVYGGVYKDGSTAISFAYDGLLNTSIGLIWATQNGKYGFLNADGSVAIPFEYDSASLFGSTGLAVVVKDGNAQVIDSKGNPVQGAENVDTSAYILDDGTLSSPSTTVTIREDGLVGYGKIDYTPELPTADDMSDWAVPLVVESIEAGLVPISLQNMYTANITRADFAYLAVESLSVMLDTDVEALVLSKTGKSLDAHIAEYPFVDTSSSVIIAAKALGIVSGKEAGKFDPYASITRQEAAIMLKNMVTVAGKSTTPSAQVSVEDVASIATWALDAVSFVSEAGIMSTSGGDNFAPTSSYTRQQSYLTVLKVLEAIQ